MDGYEAASKIRSMETFMTEAGQLVTPLWIVALCANAIQANPKLLPHGMQVGPCFDLPKSRCAHSM